MQSSAVSLFLATLHVSHFRVLGVFFVFSELVDPVLELDNFDGAAEARPSAEGLDFWQQVVVAGGLAAEPDVAQSLLQVC